MNPQTKNGVALAIQRVPPKTEAGRRLLALYDDAFVPSWETFGEAVAAIEAEARTLDDLGAAWTEALAALPENCSLSLNALALDKWAEAVAGEQGACPMIAEEASTPAAALRALAARLADPS